jgi:hypothetical protein
MRETGAIDCWIEGCPWFENQWPPGARYTQEERDDARVAHMWTKHTLAEMHEELVRRGREIRTGTLTTEQREDRHAIFRILNAAIKAAEQHPLPDDPKSPSPEHILEEPHQPEHSSYEDG